jgi:hypothetical protein
MKTNLRQTLLGFLLLSQGGLSHAAASIEVKCEAYPYGLVITEASIGGRGHGEYRMPIYLLTQNRQTITTGNSKLAKVTSGLARYNWFFKLNAEDSGDFLSVTVPGLREPTPGEHSAQGAFSIHHEGEIVERYDAECVISIN